MVESQKLEEKAKEVEEADAGAAGARACGVINKYTPAGVCITPVALQELLQSCLPAPARAYLQLLIACAFRLRARGSMSFTFTSGTLRYLRIFKVA